MRLDKCDAYTAKKYQVKGGENPMCQWQEKQQKRARRKNKFRDKLLEPPNKEER